MKQIWKYQLTTTDEVSVNMPRGATILSLQVQHGRPCIWALVDPPAPNVTRRFRIFRTGHRIDGLDRQFIGTFQVDNGNSVFHVFEDTE